MPLRSAVRNRKIIDEGGLVGDMEVCVHHLPSRLLAVLHSRLLAVLHSHARAHLRSDAPLCPQPAFSSSIGVHHLQPGSAPPPLIRLVIGDRP
eukprot:135366-Pleurochrysis_carterae.AAC.1